MFVPDSRRFVIIKGKRYRRMPLYANGTGGYVAYIPKYLLYRLAADRRLEELVAIGITEDGEADFEVIGLAAEDMVEEEDPDVATAE